MEDIVGYSRAIKIENTIEVAGTTAIKDGMPFGVGNPYLQTKYILSEIEKILNLEGFCIEHVYRTRMFVTDITVWEEIGKAHGEVFKDIKPVATMVEVSSLIEKDLLVEIEVSAIKS
ncbi:RidA family protein [Enterococcus sp. HY326]|uniref:RidA family protein n=1 Tax=Enterococcus sp. HY326 TaxID=2971265 RepID=UPI00223EA909|nr:RidA family protein [Enterococcus sp. HY326]